MTTTTTETMNETTTEDKTMTATIPTIVTKLFTRKQFPWVSQRDGILTVGDSDTEFAFAADSDTEFAGRLAGAWHECAKAGMQCELKECENPYRPKFQSTGAVAHVVNVDDLLWVAKASDTESSRFTLGGVAITVGGAIVATDGRRIHFVGPTDSPEVMGIVPIAVVKAIAKLVKKGKSVTFIMVGDGRCFEVVLPCGTVVTARAIEGRFPRWVDVLPETTERSAFTMPTKQEFLSAKAEAARKNVNLGKKEAPHFPLVNVKNGPFNAEYIADLGADGEVSWSSPLGAHQFNMGNRMAVVMPMDPKRLKR